MIDKGKYYNSLNEEWEKVTFIESLLSNELRSKKFMEELVEFAKDVISNAEEFPGARISALSAIRYTEKSIAIHANPALKTVLLRKGDDIVVRQHVINTISFFDIEELISPLCKIANDRFDDIEVRLIALAGMATMPLDDWVYDNLRSLREDPDLEIRESTENILRRWSHE